jgi:hypothetical protein
MILKKKINFARMRKEAKKKSPLRQKISLMKSEASISQTI